MNCVMCNFYHLLYVFIICIIRQDVWKVAYLRNQTAGSNRVSHAERYVVRVFTPAKEILVSQEVGTVIDHEAAALHPAGGAPAQVGGHV